MQIKTTVDTTSYPLGDYYFLKSKKGILVKSVEKLTLLYNANGNVNSLAVPQKLVFLKYGITIWPRNYIPRHIPKSIESKTDACTPVFIATLFTIANIIYNNPNVQQ